MRKCVQPIEQEFDELSPSVRPVTRLEAELSPSGRTVVLSLDDPGRYASEPMVYVLSPPAAAQLSRLLRKVVKEYLRAVPGEDHQV